jgi:hypothetical protein
LRSSTGLEYAEFQERFFAWLEVWEDPAREEVRRYITTLDEMMDSQRSISKRREARISSGLSRSEEAPMAVALAKDAEALRAKLQAVSPPAALHDLHDDALASMDALVEWLSIERDFTRTGIDTQRVQANNMIPEVDARRTLLLRRISSMKFTYRTHPDDGP